MRRIPPLAPSRWLAASAALAGCSGGTKDGPQLECDPAAMIEAYEDRDRDGFGLHAEGKVCALGDGLVDTVGDCDDADPLVNPAAEEVCDAVDNDCDQAVDEDVPVVPWYLDADGDGYGDEDVSVEACAAPAGHVADPTDCDDANASVSPGSPEVCDYGVDNDCDGVSESPDDVDQYWYADQDGDGVGAGETTGFGCLPPTADSAPATAGLDCDDTDPFRYPGASETCGDGIDQDCSGSDSSCAPIGSFYVDDGPYWGTDPPVYSCIEACALLFGGVASDYRCSTSDLSIDGLAFLSGFGDDTYCTVPRPEDYSLEPATDPGYDCVSMMFGCSYSAYVQDHCGPPYDSRNYCWRP